MSTQFYADIPTAIKHSRHVAKAPLTWDPIAHVTSRFGFGPTPGLRAAVAKHGMRWWLSRQTWYGTHHSGYRAHAKVAAVGPQLGLSPYDARQWLIEQGNEYGWDIMDQLCQVTLGLQTWSPAQLYESLVDFFSNHLNVPNHAGDMWNTRAAYDREVIRPYAMDDFTSMLLASARHPAMLTYLNLADSTKAAINENYGRELLELHTVGLRYSESDVRNCAAMLTGRTLDDYQHYLYDEYIHPTGRIKVLGFTDPNSDAGERRGRRQQPAALPRPAPVHGHEPGPQALRPVRVRQPVHGAGQRGRAVLPRRRDADHADGQDDPDLERVLAEPRRQGAPARRERDRDGARAQPADHRLRQGHRGDALDHQLDEQRAARLAGAQRLSGRRRRLALGRQPADRVERAPRHRRRLVAGLRQAGHPRRCTTGRATSGAAVARLTKHLTGMTFSDTHCAALQKFLDEPASTGLANSALRWQAYPLAALVLDAPHHALR